MPPQVIDSTSELRFKQCSIGDMGYVNVCGTFGRQIIDIQTKTDRQTDSLRRNKRGTKQQAGRQSVGLTDRIDRIYRAMFQF